MIETLVPDWARIIADLSDAGHGSREVSKVMQTQITDRMIRWYGEGMQPAYWRGKLLIDFWCETLRRNMADVPLTQLKRGYRAQGQYARDTGPRLQALPQWPVAAPVSAKPIKRRKGVGP